MNGPLAARGALVGPLGRGGGAADPRVVYDPFTGADGTMLYNHTPDKAPPGATWSYLPINGDPNTLYLRSNRAGTVDYYLAVVGAIIDSGIADGTIMADITVANSTGAANTGLLFRTASADNRWQFILITNPSGAGTGSVRLIERTAGVSVVRATTNADVVPGSTYAMSVALAGTSIVCAACGMQISFTSSVRSTITSHGIILFTNSLNGSYADNFTVQP